MTDPAAQNAFENLRLEVREGVAVVTVSRPKALNALNDRTLDELERAFAAVARDPAVAGAVLTGDGEKAFVAGADIAELAKMGPAEASAASAKGQRVFASIERCGKPVVAAVNGFALGGGLELALACHVRFACPEAKVGLPEVSLGLIPGYGGTQRLARIAGPGRAFEMILSGDMADAASAERYGIVQRIVPRETLVAEAVAFVKKVAARGPVAVRYAAEAVLSGVDGTHEQGYRREQELFGACFATEDMREGTGAFLEKRKAQFKGR
ncbi:MAG: Crotonyl-CoA hydratase [Planctomycetes bacterium]|nr:Crotonyl-CoA hydratase [Planctomycetota bacterium]